MPAGNVGYSDTRNFSGSLLGDLASAIKNRIGDAAKMARQERANAAKELNVGGRDDGVTQEEFDKQYGKGFFFKRALGSKFGGDRVARTRGYFEKDPPEGRDPTKTAEERFSAQFDYKSTEGMIKGARPLQGPQAPEYLYSYDRRYKDQLPNEGKFQDDTLDKEKMKAKTPLLTSATRKTKDTRFAGRGGDSKALPVVDEELNQKVASALSGVEVQMTRLEQKMDGGQGDGNDGEVAQLVQTNTAAIVAGFSGLNAALSSLLGAFQGQTKDIKDRAQKRERAEVKAEAREDAKAEEELAEINNASADNEDVEYGSGGGGQKKGLFGSLLDRGGDLLDLVDGRRRFRSGKRMPGARRRLARMRMGRFMRGARGRMGRMGLRGFQGLRGFGTRAAGFGARAVGAPLAKAALLWGVLEGGFPASTARYDQVYGPNAYYNDPKYRGPKPKTPQFRTGGYIPAFSSGSMVGGGRPTQVTVGDTPPGVAEAIIPFSAKTFKDSEEARIKVMKKNRSLLSDIQSDGFKDFFSGPDGWADMAKKLWEGIKGMFGMGDSPGAGGEDSEDLDIDALKGAAPVEDVEKDTEFQKEVQRLAKRMNMKPSELMALYNAESGLDPSIVNSKNNAATGIFQLMFGGDFGDKRFGFTQDEFRNLSRASQVKVHEKYLEQAGFFKTDGGLGNAALANIAPAYLGKVGADDTLYEGGSEAYRDNKNVDMLFGNKDGNIQLSDYESFIRTRGNAEAFSKFDESTTPASEEKVTPQEPPDAEESPEEEEKTKPKTQEVSAASQLEPSFTPPPTEVAGLDPTQTGASNPAVFKAAQKARAQARAEGLPPEEVEKRVIEASIAAKNNSQNIQQLSSTTMNAFSPLTTNNNNFLTASLSPQAQRSSFQLPDSSMPSIMPKTASMPNGSEPESPVGIDFDDTGAMTFVPLSTNGF